MTMLQRTFALAALGVLAVATHSIGQSSLVCPALSADTLFEDDTLETECSALVLTGCTAKSGVTWDEVSDVLKLPSTTGAFQPPPGAEVDENVLFAATADFDRDGWDDIAVADDDDRIFVMRNQTITCGKTSCTGGSSTAPTRCDEVNAQCTAANVLTSSDTAWWSDPTNKRRAAFRKSTNGSGTLKPLKATPSSTPSLPWTPMVAGDFNGDGWPDFIAISYTHAESSTFPRPKYANAARLYLNTKNCHKSGAPQTPCGIGMLCGSGSTAQTSNGACSGGGSGWTSGTPRNEGDLSCTNTTTCPDYHPTFAAYDLRDGSAESSNNAWTTGSTASPLTYRPGDFGPLSRPTTQMQVLDWDGDGDLDFLFGHGASGSTYDCPSTSGMCTTSGKDYYVGIDVWLNDCADGAWWDAATKSCPSHIPTFSHAADSGACDASSCDNADTLFPSTAHNTSIVAPSSNAGFDYDGGTSGGTHKVPVFAYANIDNDNDLDLVLGSVGCCSSSSNSHYKLRIYKNTSDSMYVHMLDTDNPIILSTSDDDYPGFEGALTAVFVHDFSGDGYPDIITGTDAVSYSGSIGGRTRYWLNTGDANNPFGTAWPNCLPSADRATCTGCSAACNPNPTQILSQSCGSSSCSADPSAAPPEFPDFDNGLMMNYDKDPSNTQDLILTNAAPTSGGDREFYVFPNRMSAGSIDACGTVVSGTLPEPSSESTVTGACLTPEATIPNATSSIRWYLSNENPDNFLLACTQTQSGISPDPCCVSFTNVTGKTIKWKGIIDTNNSDDGGPDPCSVAGSASPTIASVSANYRYNATSQHYRAGVVVSDGVSHVGSFRQPGNRGHFYGLAAGDGTKYYDASTKIDGQATRNVYTADGVGANIGPIAFSPVSPSTTLQARIGASSATEATTIINWVLSARFGVTTTSKLGAVMGSTPAILTPPFRPAYYAFLNATDKGVFDTFASTHSTRVPLALFASMDGMIHAIYSVATDIGNSVNGTEAWAFVPPYVAASMKADYTASCPAGVCSTTSLSISSYPDGSPTLVDYRKADGTVATVALVGDGAGGSSLTALDVTSTVSSGFALTTPPDPLWSEKPGDTSAGKATAKPAVARVKLDTTGLETFVVVAATGFNSSDPTKGKIVAGYKLETGELLWKFEAECPITSDVTVFETDDDNEPDSPAIDGFVDRAVFADNCGYVYKVRPGVDKDGDWLDNENYGSIALADAAGGKKRRALFSTTQTGALGTGEERPIVGTIGARTDNNTDMVLFFGTGGLESFAVTEQNEFYAVRAKNGTIRNKVTGSCTGTSPNLVCEKFYGGVVITTDSVIIQRNVDAKIAGVNNCDYGKSTINFLDLTTFNQIDEITQVSGAAVAAAAGPLFGDANALYFATVKGEIKRIGQPRATSAGGDTTSGNMQNSVNTADYDKPFSLVSWRVVL